jgi:hypothetical protein
VRRFYRGFGPALLQAPISRFGDTAANVGILTLLEPYDIPLPIKYINYAHSPKIIIYFESFC